MNAKRYVIYDLIKNYSTGRSFVSERDANNFIYQLKLKGDTGCYNILAINY